MFQTVLIRLGVALSSILILSFATRAFDDHLLSNFLYVFSAANVGSVLLVWGRSVTDFSVDYSNIEGGIGLNVSRNFLVGTMAITTFLVILGLIGSSTIFIALVTFSSTLAINGYFLQRFSILNRQNQGILLFGLLPNLTILMSLMLVSLIPNFMLHHFFILQLLICSIVVYASTFKGKALKIPLKIKHILSFQYIRKAENIKNVSVIFLGQGYIYSPLIFLFHLLDNSAYTSLVMVVRIATFTAVIVSAIHMYNMNFYKRSTAIELYINSLKKMVPLGLVLIVIISFSLVAGWSFVEFLFLGIEDYHRFPIILLASAIFSQIAFGGFSYRLLWDKHSGGVLLRDLVIVSMLNFIIYFKSSSVGVGSIILIMSVALLIQQLLNLVLFRQTYDIKLKF